nr:Niemann-Pick C1 protein-like [Leptinotarsa decemlineata]
MHTEKKDGKKFSCANFSQKFTYSVVTYTELFFYKLGVCVGKHPFRTIGLCWALVLLSALGFLRFKQERNPLRLWVPPYTTFVRDSEWLIKTLDRAYQEEVVMITGDDVLTPAVIHQLLDIDKRVRTVRSSGNLTLQDVCFRIPKVDKALLKMIDGNETGKDQSTTMDPALFCSFVEAMKSECYTRSILELWGFKAKKIANITKDDILWAINTFDRNSLYGRLKDYNDLLGGVVRNESGHIISAKAIQNIWYLNVNFSSIDMTTSGNDAGTALWANDEGLDWENAFLKLMNNITKNFNHIYYSAGRSFGDISNDSMFSDMYLLVIGVSVMIVYVQLVISKFNWLEARIVLGFIGLLTIGMSFVVGAGLCSLIGIFYGPVHTSLPFLLMGLGVDDMFVILACWEELKEEDRKLPIHERVGLMLKHGGVSITITSFTDIIAFLIGSSTILPCLESFCIYAAACVLMTFIFAITFFVACFVLDQRRVENKRNGVVPWIKHKDSYIPNECSQRKYTNSIFKMIYSKVILTTPGKIIVIAITVILTGFGTVGTLKLEQHFDPEWFIPSNTYFGAFLETRRIHYPGRGFDAGLYIGRLNYSQEILTIKKISDELYSLHNITHNVQSWVDPFRNFVHINFDHDIYKEPLDDERFHIFLSKFLHSPRHAKFQANFIFDEELQCGVATPKIKLTSFDFHFKKFKNPRDQIPAMHRVREIAENANFTTGDRFATVWSQFFSTWITDEVRN